MKRTLLLTFSALMWLGVQAAAETTGDKDYQAGRWDPIHFKPAIEQATDEQCLECHREVLDKQVREQSLAGVKAAEALAWYQTVGTYQGDQETFHRRHLVTEYATQVMDLKCNTCHQGNDPRDEAGMSHAEGDPTLNHYRKHVDPNLCLKCHGQFPYQIMAVPGPWPEFGHVFQDNCLLCHVTFRTNRHQVNYLKPEAIEALGKQDADTCYGCHGGRSWYRISYPYARHPWPGMAEAVPDWAKGRPAQSEARFLVGIKQPQAPKQGDKP
ncbi:MAG: hypothetical protein MUC77_18160 [Chromatiaceae bacterium]|jgi:hypothetical protein|nr:hypothetical protein [Chromatiaceae bacterium]